MFSLRAPVRILLAAVLAWLAAAAAPAGAETLYPAPAGPAAAENTVTVYSSLDEVIAVPLIRAFQAANPAIAVNYAELQTVDIYDRVLEETRAGRPTADIAISSAMDLQMKLANDGYAMRVATPAAAGWPTWANWRDTAFALTFEPAVIVYNKPFFAEAAPPTTHGELDLFLARNGNRIFGRIGTYDIERAGVGFLFLARDVEHYRDIWDLVASMGAAGVKLYSTSSAILERVTDGRMVLGYNILGSYARRWAENNPDLGIVMPRDYTVVMSRLALVPRAAREPEMGRRFLEFLLSRQGQEVLARETGLAAIHPLVGGDNTATAIEAEHGGQLRPVPVTPGLLVYLDQVKRARLSTKWNQTLRAP